VALADAFELPTAAREQRTRDGKNRSRWENRVRFGRQRLLKRGFVLAKRRGRWEVTPIGFKHLESLAKDANGKRTLL
jgi:restriction endonuclease Mrr